MEAQKIEFRWRVLMQAGNAQAAKIAELYSEYASQR
jgi:hypothetical protein